MHPYVVKFVQQLVIRGRSSKTIDGYTQSLCYFLKRLKGRTPSSITIADINDYQHYLATVKKQANSYVNAQTGSIKFFCQYVLNKEWDYSKIPYKKVHSKLPIVLSKESVVRLLASATNPKHRALLAIMYGSGMRPFEVVALKVADFHVQTDEKTIHVRNGKGGKDRHVNCPAFVLKVLSKYYRQLKKQNIQSEWLFPGIDSNKHLDSETIGAIYRRLKPIAKIHDDSCCYSLRHSFATHSLEDGVDIRTIQEIMGHSSLEVTMIYLKIAKKRIAATKSPLDSLNLTDLT